MFSNEEAAAAATFVEKQKSEFGNSSNKNLNTTPPAK